MSASQCHRSWSKTVFVRACDVTCRNYGQEDQVPDGSRVRARARDICGKLIDDFCFVRTAAWSMCVMCPRPRLLLRSLSANIYRDYSCQRGGINFLQPRRMHRVMGVNCSYERCLIAGGIFDINAAGIREINT